MALVKIRNRAQITLPSGRWLWRRTNLSISKFLPGVLYIFANCTWPAAAFTQEMLSTGQLDVLTVGPSARETILESWDLTATETLLMLTSTLFRKGAELDIVHNHVMETFFAVVSLHNQYRRRCDFLHHQNLCLRRPLHHRLRLRYRLQHLYLRPRYPPHHRYLCLRRPLHRPCFRLP